MRFKHLVTFLTSASLLLLAMQVPASEIWQPLEPTAQVQAAAVSPAHLKLSADAQRLKAELWQAPQRHSGKPGQIIDLPLPDGRLITLEVFEDPILQAGIAARYPQIRTFFARGTDNPAIRGRLSFSPRGFHAMFSTGHDTVFINPEYKYTDNAADNHYRSISRRAQSPQQALRCTLHDDKRTAVITATAQDSDRPISEKRFGSQLREYRLALAATKEYSDTVANGEIADTLDEMKTAINRVNEVFERDLGVRLRMIDDTDQLISNSDAHYSNDDGIAMLTENQARIDAIVGSASYDIGHVFSTGGGGIAVLAVACDNEYKAQGVTGLPDPSGDVFYIEYVAHEIGHQLGATHTFNAEGSDAGSGFCDQNRQAHTFNNNSFLAASAYEPGSGSTIMAYAGICGPQNIQNNADDYFHARSMEQVREFVEGEINISWADGSRCGTLIPGDPEPSANAGNNYTIPANTPFKLSGSASNAADYTYTWEQFDLGNATDSEQAMHTDQGAGPLIRSRPPSASPVRYIPALDAILEGNLDKHIGERLPTTQREMNFRLTVRSGDHGVDQDNMKLNIINTAGPFRVHNINSHYNGQDEITVSWNKANTHRPPINCLHVDILRTNSNGQDHTTLLQQAANTGLAWVEAPNDNNTGRIKLRCSDNIFLDFSNNTFSTSAVTPFASSIKIVPVNAIHTSGSTASTLQFDVIRSGENDQAISVNYNISGHGSSPVTEENFTGNESPQGSIIMDAGETQASISFDVIGEDDTDTEDRFFTITINSSSDITVSRASGMIVGKTSSQQASGGSKSGNGGYSSILLLLICLLCFTGRRYRVF